jgi:hypothetical protein
MYSLSTILSNPCTQIVENVHDNESFWNTQISDVDTNLEYSGYMNIGSSRILWVLGTGYVIPYGLKVLC